MPTEEFFQLIFETKGQQAIDDAQSELAAVGAKVAALNAQYAAGSVTEEAWREGIRKQAGEMARVKDEIEGLGKAAGNGSSKVAGFGQSMLQSGRFVQDFAQGGLGGVINNIEGLTQALGLGSGLAGVLTIVGTGFLILKPQIMEFMKSLTEGGVKEFTSQLDTLNARIKELEDKPHKLTVDVQELEAAKGVVENIKRALSEVDKLRKGQAHYESESGKAIADQIAEAPGGSQAVDRTLRDVLGPGVAAQATAPIVAEINALKAKIADDLRAAANLDAAGQSGAAARLRGEAETKQKQLGQLDDKRLAAANDAYMPKGAIDQKVGQVLDGAKTGAGVEQAEAQRTLADALEKGGLGGLARGVRAASPNQLLANDQADDDLEASIEAQKAGIKGRKEAAERQKKAQEEAAKAARAKKQADGAPMDDAVRIFKGQQQAAAAKRKADGAPMDDAVRIFKGQQEAKKKSMNGAAARQREALAEQIHYDSNGGFNPDQSRQIAGRAMHLAQKNGDLMGSVAMAMAETQAAMAGFAGRMQHLEQQVQGLHGNAKQLNRRAHSRMPTALNSGGPQ